MQETRKETLFPINAFLLTKLPVHLHDGFDKMRNFRAASGNKDHLIKENVSKTHNIIITKFLHFTYGLFDAFFDPFRPSYHFIRTARYFTLGNEQSDSKSIIK